MDEISVVDWGSNGLARGGADCGGWLTGGVITTKWGVMGQQASQDFLGRQKIAVRSGRP